MFSVRFYYSYTIMFLITFGDKAWSSTRVRGVGAASACGHPVLLRCNRQRIYRSTRMVGLSCAVRRLKAGSGATATGRTGGPCVGVAVAW
jgi:hypothetical protein